MTVMAKHYEDPRGRQCLPGDVIALPAAVAEKAAGRRAMEIKQ